MSHAALLLTLFSAVLHATWNYWLKRSTDRANVIFGAGYVTVALGLPAYILWGQPSALLGPVVLWVVLSAVIHYAYRALLAATYDRADLSQSYPVVRSAPILIAVGAVLLLGERIPAWGWAGIFTTVTGIYVLYHKELSALGRGGSVRGLGFAVATMLSITCYSLVDKQGVSLGAIHPAEFFYVYDALLSLLYTATLRKPGRMQALRRVYRRELGRTLGIALLEPSSYILILTAFTMAPVSYVVSVRQVSVVVAAVLGVVLLQERAGRSRVAGAALVVAGVALLKLAG